MTKRFTSDSQRKAAMANMRGRRPGVRRTSPLTRRNALVEKHTKLVYKLAQKYRSQAGANFEDMVQEGHLGLMRAAEKFKPKKGYQFSTYATPWIKTYLQRSMGKQFDVRVPEKKLKKAIRPQMAGIRAFLDTETGTEGGIGRAHARASVSRLRKRIAMLPKQHALVLQTKYFTNGSVRPEPLTSRAVAKLLKKTPGRISQIEKSARQKLQVA